MEEMVVLHSWEQEIIEVEAELYYMKYLEEIGEL